MFTIFSQVLYFKLLCIDACLLPLHHLAHYSAQLLIRFITIDILYIKYIYEVHTQNNVQICQNVRKNGQKAMVSSLFSCVVITKEKLLFTVKVKALLNVCIHSLLQTRKWGKLEIVGELNYEVFLTSIFDIA